MLETKLIIHWDPGILHYLKEEFEQKLLIKLFETINIDLKIPDKLRISRLLI